MLPLVLPFVVVVLVLVPAYWTVPMFVPEAERPEARGTVLSAGVCALAALTLWLWMFV